MKAAITAGLLLFCLSVFAQEQDTVVLTNGLQIYGRLLTIDQDSVWLKQGDGNEVFSLPFNEIEQIRRAQANTGQTPQKKNVLPGLSTEMNVRDSLPAYSVILKTSLISPSFGHFFISREQQLRNKLHHHSVEITLGAIWVPDNGRDGFLSFDSDVLGGYIRSSYKHYYPPLNAEHNPLRRQRLMGTYYGMQLTLAGYQYRDFSNSYFYDNQYSSSYVHIFESALELITGIQYAYSERLTFSIQGGIGCAYSFITISNDNEFYISDYRFANWNPAFLSLSSTVSVGYRFKARKDR